MAAGLAGLGIIQAPTFMLQTDIVGGALQTILADWTLRVMPLHIVYAPNRHLSNKVRVFVDWVAELFASHDLMRRRAPS